MRTAKYFLTSVLAVGLLAGLGMYRAAYEEKAKFSIEEVMEAAHKKKEGQPSLYARVSGGKASKEQKQELLKLYEELAKTSPPKGKGSPADWKKRTGAMVSAARGVVADKEGSLAALKKAAACSKCHEVYKSDD